MGYVEELLARNERIVRVARDHWVTLLPVILVDVAVSIVIIGLSVVGDILSLPWAWFGLMLLAVPIIGHLALRVAGLDELRQKGVITDVEFEEKKQRLLAKI